MLITPFERIDEDMNPGFHILKEVCYVKAAILHCLNVAIVTVFS